MKMICEAYNKRYYFDLSGLMDAGSLVQPYSDINNLHATYSTNFVSCTLHSEPMQINTEPEKSAR